MRRSTRRRARARWFRDHLEALYEALLHPTDGRAALAPKTVYEVHLVIRGAFLAAMAEVVRLAFPGTTVVSVDGVSGEVPASSESSDYQRLRAHLSFLRMSARVEVTTAELSSAAAEVLPAELDHARAAGLTHQGFLERLLAVEVARRRRAPLCQPGPLRLPRLRPLVADLRAVIRRLDNLSPGPSPGALGCARCGRPLPAEGHKRRWCSQACRQRAHISPVDVGRRVQRREGGRLLLELRIGEEIGLVLAQVPLGHRGVLGLALDEFRHGGNGTRTAPAATRSEQATNRAAAAHVGSARLA